MNLAAYIPFVILGIAAPRLKKYRLVLRKVEPRKKRSAKSKTKKRKSVWIKVI